jgi:hypothetical protein
MQNAKCKMLNVEMQSAIQKKECNTKNMKYLGTIEFEFN